MITKQAGIPAERSEDGRTSASQPKMNERSVLITVLLASLVLLSIGGLIKGPYISSDTDSYLVTGERVIEWVRDANEVTARQVLESKRFPDYVISSVFLSLVYEYLGAGAVGVMVFNSILFAVIVCLIFRLWVALGSLPGELNVEKSLVLCLGIGLYVLFGLPDGFLWSYAVLTDTIFLFWVCLFVVLGSLTLLERVRYRWLAIAIVACSAPFVRPTGIVLPLLAIYLVALVWVSTTPFNLRMFAWGSVVLAMIFTFLVVPGLVLLSIHENPIVGEIVPEFMTEYFRTSTNIFSAGLVVPNRLRLDISMPPSYLDLVNVIVHRIAYYWIPIRFGNAAYSEIHNIVNLVYMLVAVPSCALGIKTLVAKDTNHALVALFLVMVALIYAFLHGVTLVSYDWRYQLPGMVPFWILCGVGLYHVLWLGYSRFGLSRD